ncbi:site-specific integrase [Brevundimonas sp. SGAir0440]|uniref:tyrosine-type recombinase/integrase n=1 Tax=Brevundimonas TaxID=41275 RepID=UPI0010CD47E2|nr:site-specific integrase [Brevundimonas sp. SGAir0440]MEE2848934.1 site-specific integrase [Pseudomonadota bacterium]QCQ99106.1 site-specific integrase [Brevundimonas sp. SGAir0440]
MAFQANIDTAWDVKQRPNGIYIVEFRGEDGQRHRVSTKSRDKRVAIMMAPQIALGITAEQMAKPTVKKDEEGKPKGMTINDLFDHCEKTVWKTHRSQATLKSTVKILREICGEDLLSDLHAFRLEEIAETLALRGGRKGGRAAPATVKRKLEVLSGALDKATKMQGPDKKPILFAKPPFPTIKVNNIQERTLTKAEVAAIFKVIGDYEIENPAHDWKRFGCFVRFLLDTACRKGEALMLRDEWITVDADGDTIISWPRFRDATPAELARTGLDKIERLKNGKAKTLPASQSIVDMLPFLRMLSPDGRLFPWHTSTMDWKWRRVREGVRKAGQNIDDVKFHTLRHTTITDMLRNKESLTLVSRFAGHSSVKITADRYGHIIADDLKGLVKGKQERDAA